LNLVADSVKAWQWWQCGSGFTPDFWHLAVPEGTNGLMGQMWTAKRVGSAALAEQVDQRSRGQPKV